MAASIPNHSALSDECPVIVITMSNHNGNAFPIVMPVISNALFLYPLSKFPVDAPRGLLTVIPGDSSCNQMTTVRSPEERERGNDMALHRMQVLLAGDAMIESSGDDDERRGLEVLQRD